MVRNVMLLCVAIAMVATSATASNLVLNGGFTLGFSGGTFTDWVTSNCTNAQCTAASWALANPYPAIGGDVPTDSTGAETGCTGSGCNNQTTGQRISQALSTTPGQVYTLVFYYVPALHPPGPNYQTELDVFWNGSLITNGQIVNAPSDTWTEYTFNLAATGSSTVLEFTDRADPDFSLITDISVNPYVDPATLPEPVSFALIGAGLLCMGAFGKKIQRRKI